MNTILKFCICAHFVLLFNSSAFCQAPFFEFDINFEDNLGKKDTIRFILDNRASYGTVDSIFMEHERVDTSDGNFHVFLGNTQSRVFAMEANGQRSFDFYVSAVNYRYPIRISCDTSLFYNVNNGLGYDFLTAGINNEWFFLNNNGAYHSFNMLKASSVSAPAFTYGSQSQFPMLFIFSNMVLDAIPELNSKKNQVLIIQENGLLEVSLRSGETFELCQIFNSVGQQMVFVNELATTKSFDYHSFTSGYYSAILKSKNNLFHGAFIKF